MRREHLLGGDNQFRLPAADTGNYRDVGNRHDRFSASESFLRPVEKRFDVVATHLRKTPQVLRHARLCQLRSIHARRNSLDLHARQHRPVMVLVRRHAVVPSREIRHGTVEHDRSEFRLDGRLPLRPCHRNAAAQPIDLITAQFQPAVAALTGTDIVEIASVENETVEILKAWGIRKSNSDRHVWPSLQIVDLPQPCREPFIADSNLRRSENGDVAAARGQHVDDGCAC